MTQKEISKKRKRLEATITKANNALNDLRESCQHTGNLIYTLKGSIGNWDKSDDSYWIRWECEDCGKIWTTPQDNISYLTKVKYPNAKEYK